MNSSAVHFSSHFFLSLSSNPTPSQPMPPGAREHGRAVAKTVGHRHSRFGCCWLMTAAGKTNCRAFLPWFAMWLPTLLNHVIYLWLIRHMEAPRQLMTLSWAYLAQLWGNGKCRAALSPDHLNVVSRNPRGLRRKWFAEEALVTTVETTTIHGTK